MASDRKSYEAEIKGFLVSPSVIITGNILDALSGRHMQFLYNSYTEKHGKKFLKEVTLLGKMEAIAPDMGFGIGACGDYEGIASGDRQWFDKGKCEIEKWLKWNGGSKIRVPSNLRMCRRRANALIGDYNEWEKSHACGAPCLFKFLPEEGESQYWGFDKACHELGYTLVDTSVRLDGAGDGLTPRLGIYDMSGYNLAPNTLNYYADYAEDRL